MHEDRAMARGARRVDGVARGLVAFDGERGVIDVVVWHADSRSLLLIELKTRIVDVSALMATMDVRRRVARRIARDHGWDPAT